MTEFLNFLKNPTCSTKFYKPNFYHLLNLFILYIFSVIMLGVFAYMISQIFGISHNKIDLSFSKKILIGFLLAPIYEEIFFRSLLKFNNQNISLFMLNLSGFVAWAVIKEKPELLIVTSFILLTTISLVMALKREIISKWISANIKPLFYLTSLLFGLFHVINFSGNFWLILLFSAILCSPQIIAGLILGYIRLKYGLVYAILFHMLINSSILIVP